MAEPVNAHAADFYAEAYRKEVSLGGSRVMQSCRAVALVVIAVVAFAMLFSFGSTLSTTGPLYRDGRWYKFQFCG